MGMLSPAVKQKYGNSVLVALNRRAPAGTSSDHRLVLLLDRMTMLLNAHQILLDRLHLSGVEPGVIRLALAVLALGHLAQDHALDHDAIGKRTVRVGRRPNVLRHGRGIARRPPLHAGTRPVFRVG